MTTSRERLGFIGVENTDKFLEIADNQGWQYALKSAQKPDLADKLKEALAPNRLAWLKLVNINSSTQALDIGAGTGGIACQLAKECYVTAIDSSITDVLFLKIRAQQDHLHKLNILRANAIELPFSSNCFDVITMNGVLEWVPVTKPDKDPRLMQLIALKEARRVLRPEGKLLLGIENRYYIGYFLGIPEPHINLRYISLMGRSDAQQLSYDIKNLPFLEYTYSRKECLDLIREAGFDNVEAYWFYPDYRLPQFIIPLNNLNALKFFVENFLPPPDSKDRELYSIYQFYKFAAPETVRDFVGHFGFVCY